MTRKAQVGRDQCNSGIQVRLGALYVGVVQA